MGRPLPELHARALGETRKYIAAIRPDQWSAPTPDPEWDVRTLVNHIVAGNCWVTPLMTGRTIDQVGDAFDGDVLGDDPLAAYDRSAKEAAETFDAPGAMEVPANVSYGPVPGEIYAGHRFLDVLIHGWDVAKATGQDPTLDPVLVGELRAIVDPQLAMLQASGAFGRVDVPPGADPQTELLALLGRRA